MWVGADKNLGVQAAEGVAPFLLWVAPCMQGDVVKSQVPSDYSVL